MALKRLNKAAGKRKQNGKKGQASKMKGKSEMEVLTAKEQISELDKEILTIQINELEGKLKRKQHLCSYMEEEISIYKTLYSGKLFLKSESMKLLNEAFHDFASDIFLLDEEYKSMKSLYSNFSQRQLFCMEYQKSVNMLSAVGSQLEENLLESEKCFEELPVFRKTFSDLEDKASTEEEIFKYTKEEIARKFHVGLLRIQDQVRLKTDSVIHDIDLKHSLLPLSWQALFHSGWFSQVWSCSALDHLEHQKSENVQLQKDSLLQLKVDSLSIMSSHDIQIPSKCVPYQKTLESEELHQQYSYIKALNLAQQNKIEGIKSEMADLEKAIYSLEISGETHFMKSYLIQIVHKAGNLLKQVFET